MILCEFSTGSVRDPENPQSDTCAIVCFPRRLVARPRLAHGIRALDVDKRTNIRVKSMLPHFTDTWADCHITAWLDTTLYCGIAHILVLTPADLDFLTGEHMRTSDDPPAMRVDFERRFVTPPKVVVFFNELDLGSGHNWRLSARASDVDASGFTLHVDTWGDMVLYAARACWVAYPEDREHIYSTSVNTMDLHIGAVTRPRLENETREIGFGAVSFWENPSVFVALNLIDVDCKSNLRVNAYVDNVTKTGLVCHIDSWHDTVLYAAGVSIIAFN